MTSALSTTLAIEACREDHVAAIQAIYAHYVATSLATFETEAPSTAQMLVRRLDILRAGYPYLVAMLDGQPVGYAYASAWRTRAAYRYTAENSIYVAAGHQGAGVGRRLMEAVIAECHRRGFHRMVAVIGDSGNAASIGLHRAMGFQHAGTLADTGYKFGRWVDTVMMQRGLAAPA